MKTMSSPTNTVLAEALRDLTSKDLAMFEKEYETEENPKTALDKVNGQIPAGLESIPLIRFSSDKQKDGYSDQRQMELILQSARENNWTVNETLKLADLGVSGYQIDPKTGRPYNMSPEAALGAFMLALDKGLIDVRGKVIHVEAVDRFSRACLDTAESAFWALVRKGLSFYFINNRLFIQPSDKDDPIKKIVLILEFDKANHVAKAMSRRQKDTLTIKLIYALKGQKVNWGAWLPSWVSFVKEPQPHYEWKPQNYKTLLRIVDGVVNNKPLNAIARKLNEEKVPCFEWGKNWTTAGIQVILKNPALLGTFRFRKRVIENYYPAAVTPEVFSRLQARFAIPRKAGGGTAQGNRITSLFPGLVKCAHCLRTMHAQLYNDPESPFSQRVYVCRSHEDHGAGENGHVCMTGQRIYIDPIEHDFCTSVLTQSPAELLLKKDHQRQLQLNAARTDLVDVSTQISKFMAMAAKYQDTEEIEKQLDPLYAKKKELKAQIAELDTVAALSSGVDGAWTAIIKALKGAGSISGASDDQIRDFVAASKALREQLYNQEVRRNVIGPIKALISKIEIDGPGCRYRVYSITGGEGNWRDVSAGVASLWEQHAAARNTEDVRKRQSEARKEWWKKKGLSAESIAAGKAKRAATWAQKTYEEKKAMREKQSAIAKKWFASMTPERKRLIRQKQSDIKLNRGPDMVKRWSAAMNAKARQTRANWTPEQRQAISAKMSATRRAFYASMSPEEKAVLSAKRRATTLAFNAKRRSEKEAQQAQAAQVPAPVPAPVSVVA